MKSKNVKIIDDHGIDRVASVICSIDVDGSDYVIYWIERDSDNDNLFVSKLIKNNDGTSNMLNVEDSMEKSNLNEVVKELITRAINDDSDKLSTNAVVLKNGKNVKISSVLFNKEQNINVQKTYITTVKKSVTSVSEKYYQVEDVVSKEVFENNENAFVSPQVVQESSVVVPVDPIVNSAITQASVQNSETLPVENILDQQNVVSDVSSLSVASTVPPVSSNTVNVTNKIEEIPAPVVETPVVVVEQPVVEKTQTPQVQINVAPVVEPIDNLSSVSVAQPANLNNNTNISGNVVDEMVVAPTPVNNQNVLFFDGSNETNLAGAFNTTSEQPKVAVESINPIREFGQDIPLTAPVVENVQPDLSSENKPSGFANNKFFMVVAVIFFLASCIFLGYEVFRYFQIK